MANKNLISFIYKQFRFILIFNTVIILLVLMSSFSTAINECDSVYVNSNIILKEDYETKVYNDICFIINKSDIIFNCDGHTIRCDKGITAVKIKEGVENIEIKNCIFKDCDKGVYTREVEDIRIHDLEFIDCGKALDVTDASRIRFQDNKISSKGVCCAFDNVNSSSISNNSILITRDIENKLNFVFPVNNIILLNSNNNTLEKNQIDGLGIAVMISNSEKNRILNNLFKNNVMGVYLGGSSFQNNILNNDFSNVLGTAIGVASDENTVLNNTIFGGEYSLGMCIGGAKNHINNNNISNCSVGIFIDDIGQNFIENNVLLDNKGEFGYYWEKCNINIQYEDTYKIWEGYGIFVLNSENDLIKNNTFCGNAEPINQLENQEEIIEQNYFCGMEKREQISDAEDPVEIYVRVNIEDNNQEKIKGDIEIYSLSSGEIIFSNTTDENGYLETTVPTDEMYIISAIYNYEDFKGERSGLIGRKEFIADFNKNFTFITNWTSCEDGTQNLKCSINKPFLCYFGELIPECEKCGCFDDEFFCDKLSTSPTKGCCEIGKIWDITECIEKADSFTIFYLPINYNSSNDENFKNRLRKYSDHLIREDIGLTQKNFMAVDDTTEFSGEGIECIFGIEKILIGNLIDNSFNKWYKEKIGFGRNPNEEKYRVVGIDNKNTCSKDFCGFADFFSNAVYINGNWCKDSRHIVAHELGHTFGLCDNYNPKIWDIENILYLGCPNNKPNNKNSECNECLLEFGACCLGIKINENLYSTMGSGDENPPQRRFTEKEAEHIRKKIQEVIEE